MYNVAVFKSSNGGKTAMMENDWDKYIIPDLDLIAALYINI